MSLREEMWKYEQITGESAEHVPIIKLGAFLDGYEMGLKSLEQQPCSDCISRAEAIKIIKEHPSIVGNRSTIVQKIVDLPSVTPRARWIPVSEGLPEKDGEYLVCYEEEYRKDYDFDEVGIAPFEVDCEGFGYWQQHYDKSTLGYLDSDWTEISVIAWMPLPQPYKAESEGE